MNVTLGYVKHGYNGLNLFLIKWRLIKRKSMIKLKKSLIAIFKEQQKLEDTKLEIRKNHLYL